MTMKRGSWMAALLSTAALLGLHPRPACADEGLALRRVLLSSGGVGYFEYEAKVHSDADLPLEVRLDQVDDVLKSVVHGRSVKRLKRRDLTGKTPTRRG